jgi:hypothetical protein
MILSELIRAMNKGDSNMIIKIQLRYQYNQEVYYPICANATLFAEIAGTKTLTARVLKRIEKLGYTIEVEHQAPRGWGTV